MTTYRERKITCSNCGKTSQHHTLGSTNALGSPDLDLRPPAMQRHTMDTWLQECPTCGYVAPSLDVEENRFLIERALKTAGELASEGKIGRSTLEHRFATSAVMNELDGDFEAAKKRWLQCAWAADDRNNTESAVYCRNAFLNLAERQVSESIEAKAQRVDVLRRAGRFREALALALSAIPETENEVVLKILNFQMFKAKDFDSETYTIADAVN